MGINFPASPTVGQKYPQPAVAGIPVYTWDGEKWTTVGGSVAAYALPSTILPLMDATPAVTGVGTAYTREDHVHPTDTTRAAVNTVVRYDTAQALTAAQQQQARQNIGSPVANLIINGDFRVNQVSYVSAAVLAAGVYGHDQWKAGASGGDYSFTQLKSSTQITIASGKSLIQPIEDVNIAGGSYVLSWTGTAQARAGVNTLTPSGSYTGSPLLITGQTAGTAMSVEFNPGTLGTIKLESGALATPFVTRPFDQELATCRRYFEKSWDLPTLVGTPWGGGADQLIYAHPTGLFGTTVFFAPKRAVPSVTVYDSGGNPNVVTGYTTGWINGVVPNITGIREKYFTMQHTSAGVSFTNFGFKADARL